MPVGRRGSVHDKAYAVEARLNALGLWSDAAGFLRYAGADGNTYEAGNATFFATAAPQSIVSTTPAVITGCSAGVGTGTYRITALILGTQNATGGQVQNFRFNGPAITSGRLTAASLANGASVGLSSTNVIGSSTLSTGVAFGPNAVWLSMIWGWYSFSASGTLQLTASEGTSQSWTVTDAWFDLIPLA